MSKTLDELNEFNERCREKYMKRVEGYGNDKKDYVARQKVKDIAKQIQEEYDKVQEQFDCIWNKKSKDNYDRYKIQELSAMQQELGFILGKFEELLEEGE